LLLHCPQAGDHRFQLGSSQFVLLEQILTLAAPVAVFRLQAPVFPIEVLAQGDQFIDSGLESLKRGICHGGILGLVDESHYYTGSRRYRSTRRFSLYFKGLPPLVGSASR